MFTALALATASMAATPPRVTVVARARIISAVRIDRNSAKQRIPGAHASNGILVFE